MTNVQEITANDLVKIFLNPEMSGINGASFIGIDTATTVKLTGGKKNEMQGKVIKNTIGSSVMVFQNKNSNGYSNMVQRRLEQEGKSANFEVKPRTWGIRVENTPLVEHKGQFYLEVIFLKSGKVSYSFNGQSIEKSLINGLPTRKESNGQGGLENAVIVRSFKVESVTRITINKQTYIVK